MSESIDSLSDYAEQFLLCRDLRHAWGEQQAGIERRQGKQVIVRILTCGRCNMTRLDTINNRGERLRTEYRQPAGYKLSFRPVMADVRRLRFAQLVKSSKTKSA